MSSRYVTNRSSLLALSCVMLSASPLLAQGDRGALTGRITDGSGALAPGASLVLTNEGNKTTVRSTSNKAGEYTFSSLVAGRYTLTITAPGFKAYKAEHVQIDVGETATADAVLALGSASSEVTVQADTQQLSTTSASLGLTVEEKSMTDLPLIYGNPFSLAFLAPGVTLSGVNPNLHVYDSGTTAVSVNGSQLNSIDFKLDGAADNRIRVTAFTPNTESISQYRLATANYDATQGHASGGFVNVQTKSGTDKFHGSLFGYYQNPKINANVWLLNPGTTPQVKPTFVREGVAFGGPIVPKKLFFFVGVEHSRQGSPDVGSLQVPTAAEKAGDFSALLGLDTTVGAKTCGATPTVLTGTINKYQLFDPKSAVLSGTTYQRLCIPGNNVAKYTTISPIVQKLFAYYPDPNAGTADVGTYNYAINGSDNYTGAIVRLDYQLSQTQSMYGHLIRSGRQQHSRFYFNPVSGTNLDYENYGAAIGHTAVLGPTAVLNTVVSYTRFTNQNTNTAQGSVTPTSVGFPDYLQNGLPDSAAALPRVDITGYTSLNTSSATQTQDDIYLANSTLSKQLRTHYLRFGAEYRRYITNGVSGQGENGSYTSNGNLATAANGTNNTVGGAGFSIAALEFGLISSGSQTQNSDFSTRSDYWAGFVQDDWRVSQRLTVNAGLRYEYERPMYERNNKEIVAFDFNATNNSTASGAAAYLTKTAGKNALLPATITPTGGAVFANTNGYGRDPYNSPKFQIAPRIGFAYSATPTTVLRGGYGLFFDTLVLYYLSGGNGGSTTTFLVPQQGYSQTSNVTAPTYTNGMVNITSSLANPFPSGLTPVTGNAAGYNTALGQDIQFLQPNPHQPYNQRFSLGVQQRLGKFIFAIDYVGNHGVHLPIGQISTGTNYGGRDFNPIPAQYLSTVNNAYDAQANFNLSTTTVANPFSGILPSNSINGLSSSTIAVGQLLRPRPEFGRINAFTTDGTSIYHSAQVQLQRRFTGGLSTTAAFTYSKSMDATVFLNPTDPRPWYGVSANDRPLRFSTSVIYQLPFGKGRRYLSNSRGILAQVVGGWQAQGIYQIQSGAPLTFSGNDVYYGTNPGDAHWSRDQYKSTQVLGSGKGGYWFNPANFLTSQAAIPGVHTVAIPTYNAANPATFVIQNAFPNASQIRTFAPRYNTLRADHLNQADVGLQRQFQIFELGTLQFRAEAINVLNHPVYSAPASTDPTNASFGQITSQGNQPRVFQFAGFFRF